MTTVLQPDLISEVQEIAAPLPRITGGVLYAPLGTVVQPTDATTPVDDGFVTLGRVSADGVDRTEDRGQVDIYDWAGNLIAVLQDKFGLTLKFKLLQLMNADVQGVAHGSDNVTVTPPTSTTGTTINAKINALLLNTGIWVIDAYYNLMSMRFVIPNGRPTLIGPLRWVNKEIAAVDVTLRPFPDNLNNHAYEYWNDGLVLGASGAGVSGVSQTLSGGDATTYAQESG
jgi:hypothetical protein